MPFILNDPIANTNPASYSLQAQLDSIDFQNLSDPLNRVISGCVVTATSGMGLAISSGSMVIDGTDWSYAGGSTGLMASGTDVPRFDLITFSSYDNVLIANDASFETNAGRWGIAGTTASAVAATDTALDGSRSLKITNSGSTGTATVSTPSGTAGYPAIAGLNYFGMAYLKAGSTGRTAQGYLSFYDSSGTLISSSTSTNGADVTGSWSLLTFSGTAPAATAYIQMVVQTLSTGSAEVHYLDCAAIYTVLNLATMNMVPDSAFQYPLNPSSQDGSQLGWNASGSNNGWSTSNGVATYTAPSTGAQGYVWIVSPFSAQIPLVPPSTTYTFYIYVDATGVTGAQCPGISIDDPALSSWQSPTLYPTPGSKGYLSFTWTPIAGETFGRVLIDTANRTMNAGDVCKFSMPQLIPANQIATYSVGPTWTQNITTPALVPVTGSIAPSPDFPSYSGVLLASVLVLANGTSITSDKIVDKRILAPDPNNQIGILSWMSY